MPDTITCTGCRAPIAIPRDHGESTIRCGICWSEVTLFTKPAAPPLPVAQALPAKPLPAKPVAQLLPPKPAARPSAVVAAPAKPAAGMAKLEGLIQKAGAKLAGPPAATPPQTARPVAALKPKAAEAVPIPSIQPKPAPQAAMPVPVPQAPVPTPVRVPPSHPPVEVQAIPNAAPLPVVVPIALNSGPLPSPVVVDAVPVPAPVPVAPVPAPPAPTSGPVVVQGEVAEESKKSSSRRDGESRSQYKRRHRDDDDDDDEDDDRRSRRGGKTKNGQMIAVIVGGILFFLVLCVGGYYLSRAFRSKEPQLPDMAAVPPANGGMPNARADRGVQLNPPNPDAPAVAPAFNPNAFGQMFPNMPQPAFPPAPALPNRQVRLEWFEYAGDGYKVKLGAQAHENPVHVVRMQDNAFFDYHARGKSVKTNTPPAAKMEVITVDIPQGMNPDLKKVVAEPFGQAERVTACKVAGKDGLEYEERGAWVTTTRLVQVGCRVFVFRFTGWEAFGDKASIEEAKKTFYDSVTITFDAATPAPVDPALRPRNNPRFPPNPVPPGFDPGFPVLGGQMPGGLGSLKLAGRIDPFISAVMFPDRQEAFTVALRPGSRTAGELRRYEYPGFKLKNTYLLPFAGTFAAGSDKTNRLAITTLARVDGYADGERSIVVGDVQLFDLKPIFDGKTQQREELKPLTTLTQPANTRLVGLEISPDGDTVYYLGLAKGTTPAKPFRVKLTRADTATGKVQGSLDLPEPAWRTRLSADGSKLFAAEVPLNAAGSPMHTRSTNIVTVDLARWHVERTDQVAAGTAFDFVPLSSDSLVASVIPIGGGTSYALWSLQQPAQATSLDTPGQQPLSHGYIARTPDGKRFVTSSVGRFGQPVVEVYDVSDWKAGTGFTKVASARVAKVIDQPGEPGVNLGHNFELTPDGQYAIFCDTGAVVDLSAAGKK
ncbi:zinc finger domain-containing protein [Limnoglobus roseus]|uniref:Uncharacterized protein n=1 Tax=Limnoglobus roseus TaxID=2598579 RepID=A0A5C1AU79_9BACT|nr:hypothetical protein [Limnoglobus roseus]QEL20338.1 hypothetical protein PX52LOC_07431 [Limnoglobus roseus]